MEPNSSLIPPSRLTPDTHQRGQDKLTPIQRHAKPIVSTRQRLPPWIRAKLPIGSTLAQVKSLLRQQGLATVCEEASCPNLGECFSHGTATFMIMGDRCTRRCPYCDVAHGKPAPLDVAEPLKLATAVQHLNLKYVVITSVTRDDLRDGGASQFTACITQIRNVTPNTKIEILVPDFRGRQAIALDILASNPPDVFNHNIETVPRLYATARPGANYHESLQLIRNFSQRCPEIPTKSGVMLGLGETIDEVQTALADLLAHGCQMLTLGQYLQPSAAHLPVVKFIPPQDFTDLGTWAKALGFTQVASAPLVRSSYHAEMQARAMMS